MTELRYAGFWIRLGAYILDGIFLLIITLAIITPISMVTGMEPLHLTATIGEKTVSNGGNPNEITTADYLSMLIGIAYFTLFHSSKKQATLGKMILGIYVVDENNKRISVLRAFCRWLSYLLSYLTLFIGFIVIGFNRKKRGLHDLVAGTYVIYGKPGEVSTSDNGNKEV